ncbi:MAG: hypothetical protein RIE08_15450 [Acidimicrobiales bacterium]
MRTVLILALFVATITVVPATAAAAGICLAGVDPVTGTATVRVCSEVPSGGGGQDGGTGTPTNPPPIYCSANNARVLPRSERIVYDVGCVADMGGGGLVDIPTVPVIVDLGSAIDLVALMDEATAQVEPGPPTVETSPPIGRTAVVHIPVWFWITDPWQPVSASATASIPLVSVTVTVTATPRQLTFAPGLGDPVTCDGPGVAWQPGLEDDATDCLATYPTTVGSPFAATATVDWILTWAIDGVNRGPFTTRAPSTTWEIPVTEIQALEQ